MAKSESIFQMNIDYPMRFTIQALTPEVQALTREVLTPEVVVFQVVQKMAFEVQGYSFLTTYLVLDMDAKNKKCC